MTLHNVILKSIRDKYLLITWEMLHQLQIKAASIGDHIICEALRANVDVKITKKPEGIFVEWMLA